MKSAIGHHPLNSLATRNGSAGAKDLWEWLLEVSAHSQLRMRWQRASCWARATTSSREGPKIWPERVLAGILLGLVAIVASNRFIQRSEPA